MMNRRFRNSALGVALLGVILSVVTSFVVLPRMPEGSTTGLDPDRYGILALNIASGVGLRYSGDEPPALDRGPVYPYLVALLFLVAGGFSAAAVQIFQAMLHAATTLLVYTIGSRLYDRPTALRAQAICAVHPILLWYTGRIWVETTLAFIVVLSALMVVSLFERPTLVCSALTGATLGVGTLTKSVFLLFPFVLLAMLVKTHRWEGVRHGVVVLAVGCFILAPWLWRNERVGGVVLPVHTTLGYNLIQGDVIGEGWPLQWCCNLDFWRKGQERADSLLHGRTSFRSVEGDRLLARTSLERFWSDPVFFVRRVLANFFLFWSLSESPLKSAFVGALQWVLVILACLSYIRHGKKHHLLMPVVGFTVYYVFVHAFIVGWARYSMPIIPLLLLMAAPLIADITTTRKKL